MLDTGSGLNLKPGLLTTVVQTLRTV